MQIFTANQTFAAGETYGTGTTSSNALTLNKESGIITTESLSTAADKIKYKQWQNIEGPVYSIAKAEVFKIKYANGSSDFFGAPAAPAPAGTTAYDSLMRRSRSEKAFGILGCVAGPVFIAGGGAYLILSLDDKEPLRTTGIALGSVIMACGIAESVVGPIGLIQSRKHRNQAMQLKTTGHVYMPMPVYSAGGIGIGWRMNF